MRWLPNSFRYNCAFCWIIVRILSADSFPPSFLFPTIGLLSPQRMASSLWSRTHIHSLTSPELSCLPRVQLMHTSLGGWMVPLKREKGMWKKPDVSRQKHTNTIVGKAALNISKDLSTQQKHTSMFKLLTAVSTFAFCAYGTCCYRAPAHNWAFWH